MNPTTAARVAVYVGRVLFTLALLALFGAWITQLTGAPLFGMSQQHLFSDATVFAYWESAFLDALWQARKL